MSINSFTRIPSHSQTSVPYLQVCERQRSEQVRHLPILGLAGHLEVAVSASGRDVRPVLVALHLENPRHESTALLSSCFNTNVLYK